ncbi:hypothetical protein QQS21_006797 [Conoideocrella luteorostrata]|uniref:AB hydrolase-1 domain-containing protein n=1 Tax=Conoideocrella luteorostrata TaxID=1105319 RepID=A0AAJ0CMQ6_9HYPO|nr:hypothetical protein QQS21_006797 [Conoideocrella luteorostrata]
MVSLRSLLAAGAVIGVFVDPIATAPLQTIITRDHHDRQGRTAIVWGPCPPIFSTNVTCATYHAPLDWQNPLQHGNISLGMLRIKARNPAKRIGYLFLNPGGPGGQASQSVNSIARSTGKINPELLDRFDIIGLDPRGVGLSTPVQCDVDLWNQRTSFFPQSEQAFNELVNKNKLISESCRKKSGRIVDFVDTVSAAKDHEAVRLALGDGPATFFGLSYGTQLFTQYAQLFPNGIRALLLDGLLQHSQSEYSNLLIESSTYEATLREFFRWCTAHEECVLAKEDAQKTMLEVLSKAKRAPISTPGCDKKSCRSDVTEEEILFATQAFLTSTSTWPKLAIALQEAGRGNATIFARAQGLAVGDAYEDSYLFGGASIQCQDWSHSDTTLYQLQQKQILSATMSPITKGTSQSYQIQASCIGWTAPLRNPEKRVKYNGNQTILSVNSIHDPSTSYTWALGLQNELGNSVLLTRNGSGHTSWHLNGEATKIQNAYLVNLTLPEPGVVVDS